MIGAVIGDLAAWTWECDRTCFYERLVSPEATLSGYGLLPITMMPLIWDGGIISKDRIYMTCGKALAHSRIDGIDVPVNWQRWGLIDYDKPLPFELKVAMIMSAIIDSGYLPEERQKVLHWDSFFHGGKQEYYACYMMTILRRLNEGATKDEAVLDIPGAVFNYYTSGADRNWKELLIYTTFAWRCFYYSWDFSSALYNAARCPANRHLAMMLTGAFADAMYGCGYSMTKMKYGGKYSYIEFPSTLPNCIATDVRRIRMAEFDDRHIFKKNNALTNVERHVWRDLDNPYLDRVIDSFLRKKMMRAYVTGWEDRYGVYLDNGWFYVYRSHHLLLRYKLKELEDKTFRISNLQISNDDHANVEDLGEVLYSLNYLE